MDSTWADLTDQVIQLYGAISGVVNFEGGPQTRVQVIAGLQAANNQYHEDLMLRESPVAVLRGLLGALGLEINGNRGQMAARLYNHSNPPQVPVQVANDLPQVVTGSLPSLKDRCTLQSWTSREEHQSFCNAFKDISEVLGVWQIIEPAVRIDNPEDVELGPEALQRCVRLKMEAKTMLSSAYANEFVQAVAEGQAEDTAIGLYLWVRAKTVQLGEAQRILDRGVADKFNWKGSKLSFTNWIAQLSLKMERNQDREFPTQLSFDTALRRRIIENVSRGVSPSVDAFLDSIELLAPDAPGGTPHDLEVGLVARMAKHLIDMDKSVESDCSVFSLQIQSQNELKALLAKTKDELKKEKEIQANWVRNHGNPNRCRSHS